MKALCKTFFLLLVGIALTSCGGGGNSNNSAFGGAPVLTVSIAASPTSITTNSFTTLTVSVKNPDGSPAVNGAGVQASLTPASIGSISGAGSGASGSTASTALSGGIATFIFNSSNQTGTAHIVASVTLTTTGTVNGSVSYTGSIDVNVTGGNVQDPRLKLTATTLVLPANPFIGLAQAGPNFTTNYLGSPYIAEVGVVWRHSNGELVSGTLTVNDSITPTTNAVLSELDDPATNWSGRTQTPPTVDGNEFLTLVGSEPVNVTGGVGTIYVHSTDHPGQATLTVTAIDPDTKQTISSQLTFTIAGSASGLPSSVVASSNGSAYISGSNGPQSTIVTAAVFDASDALVADPNTVDNVQFQIVGPANNDGRLVTTNAAGQQVSGTTVVAPTHNGIATATFQAGTQQGPVQIKMTADRADNNVDNGITDPVSATTTVVVSDGKLFSLTLDVPEADIASTMGVSSNVAEVPAGSGNYELLVSARAVDRQGNFVLPQTVLGFGDVDSPQTPTAGTPLLNWFLISGSQGDPQEGGKSFTATDGHFRTAGGGAGPGDTLLVIGKFSEGAPIGNDDLESSDKITSVITDTSLTVATPFNLNDTTGVSVNNGPVLPYLIGRATFSDIESQSFTTNTGPLQQDNATAILSYPASQVGKAVAVWVQGTGTDTNASPGLTRIVTDIKLFTLPGIGQGAFLTASPDPIQGNTVVSETVCYYDGSNHPIPNFDISFAFHFNGVGSGSADGVSQAGQFRHLTGANGCVTVPIVTASIPPTTTTTPPTVTFSAGPANTGGTGASVTVPIVVNAAQLQTTCTTGTVGVGSTSYVVGLRLVDASGAGIAGHTITAVCSATPPGTIAAAPILPTNATGNTSATITVTPSNTVGRCVFQDSAFPNLVASVDFTSTGGNTCNGGFSPPPN